MICQELDDLERDYIRAGREATEEGIVWSDDELRCLAAIKDHQREGHSGNSCVGQ